MALGTSLCFPFFIRGALESKGLCGVFTWPKLWPFFPDMESLERTGTAPTTIQEGHMAQAAARHLPGSRGQARCRSVSGAPCAARPSPQPSSSSSNCPLENQLPIPVIKSPMLLLCCNQISYVVIKSVIKSPMLLSKV